MLEFHLRAAAASRRSLPKAERPWALYVTCLALVIGSSGQMLADASRVPEQYAIPFQLAAASDDLPALRRAWMRCHSEGGFGPHACLDLHLALRIARQRHDLPMVDQLLSWDAERPVLGIAD